MEKMFSIINFEALGFKSDLYLESIDNSSQPSTIDHEHKPGKNTTENSPRETISSEVRLKNAKTLKESPNKK